MILKYNSWKRALQAQNGTPSDEAVTPLGTLLTDGSRDERVQGLRGETETVWLALHPEGRLVFVHHLTVPFLEHLEPWQSNIILGAFAQSLREAAYSSSKYSSLVAGTVRDTVGDICTAFRARGYPDPGRDAGGQPSILLQRQYRGY